ncbi:MAG TPA: hypothetical protein PKA06_06305 [Gemmatales bacterium]|nr:hypothetical protein [Gemmatales bacterium]HMP16257.1 hypothetical protein [Gemmatales bacterium]
MCFAISFEELPVGWVAIKASNLGYHVSMPKPDRKAFQLFGPDDKPVHVSQYQGISDKVTYTVTVTEFSKTYITQPAGIIFDCTRKEMLTRSKGRLEYEKDIVFDAVAGREVLIKNADESYLMYRVYVYNLQRYLVMVTIPSKSALENKEVQYFYKSFRLIPLKRTIK